MQGLGADVYAWWRAALDGKIDDSLKVQTGTSVDDSPQPGLYKTRQVKNGPYVPAQVFLTNQAGEVQSTWADDLIVHIVVNGQPINNVANYDRHIWFEPVSKADLAHYKAEGVWPGQIKVEATAGDNSRNMTPAETLDALIKEANEWLAGLPGGKASTREQAEQATNWSQRIGQEGKKADAKREAEKKPHWDKCKEIDSAYMPLVKKAEFESSRIGAVATAWAVAERNRLRAEQEAEHKRLMEERRKAQEAEAARVAAERAKIEAERKAQAEAAIARGAPAELITEVIEAMPSPAEIVQEAELPLPAPPAPVKVEPMGGQFGRRAGLRGRTVYVVMDYDKAFQHVKDNDKVREAIDKAIQALCKARGVALDGTEEREAVKVA